MRFGLLEIIFKVNWTPKSLLKFLFTESRTAGREKYNSDKFGAGSKRLKKSDSTESNPAGQISIC